jgi:hypothetical protein
VQIVTDGALLVLNVRTPQLCGQTEPMLGWLLAQETTRRLYDVLEVLAGNVFGSLRKPDELHAAPLAHPLEENRE